MIAVWTPPYFSSRWCMAEWESMLQRQVFLANHGIVQAQGLVLPIVFSDGKNFDPRAKNTQAINLSSLTYPYDAFRENGKYLDLDDRVRSIAEDIEARLDNSPDWHPDFPIANPDTVVLQDAPMKLPRL
ncbi:hypothetical protein [Rhizobium sp. Rhizsp82]|uniref:hypothetical protein n=1 Tax=Rhizobium sp. Rhizsp82 TaxID=3243057 RepID=UPI0039B68572